MKEIETKVKISADSKKARQEIKELERGSRDLETRITGLTREQLKLVDALGKTERGTKAYKELAKQLRDVEREAQGVSRALGQVERIQQRQEQRGARRQGFVAGLAQGTGLGQYIPTGREMGPRMAGMAIGGMARRAYGIGASPFLTPGIGGISAGLGGIPIAGGFLSGALQTAAGAYQSAVGFDRTALQMLPYAGALPTAAQQAAARARQQAAIGRKYAPRLGAVGETMAGETRRLAKSGGIELAGLPAGVGEIVSPREAAPEFFPKSMIAETPEQQKGREARDRSREGLKAAAGRRAGLLQERAAAMKAAPGLPTTGLPGIGEGTAFGMGPQEMMQLFGGMMQARGGTYDDVKRSQFREAMAAKTLYGVGAEQIGAFGRMGGAGGGGQIGPQGLSGVLQAAVAQGMRGSQVTEYLSTLVSLGQQAERTGVKLDVREFTRQTAQLTAAGMQGLQAQRIAGGMQQAAMGLSQRGVSGPMDMLLLRAAGYDPSKGAESYAQAINKMSGGMDAKMMTGVMRQVTQGVEEGGFGPEMQKLMFRRAMAKAGTQIGPDQAESLMKAYRDGGTPAVEKLIAEGEAPGARGRMIAGAKAGVGRVAPTAVGAAALEAQRIGVGREIAPAIQGMEANSMRAAAVMANFTADLQKLNGAVASMLKWLDKFTGGGLAGVVDKVVRGVLGAQGVNLPAGG